jgi:hypothetical protein
MREIGSFSVGFGPEVGFGDLAIRNLASVSRQKPGKPFVEPRDLALTQASF